MWLNLTWTSSPSSLSDQVLSSFIPFESQDITIRSPSATATDLGTDSTGLKSSHGLKNVFIQLICGQATPSFNLLLNLVPGLHPARHLLDELLPVQPELDGVRAHHGLALDAPQAVIGHGDGKAGAALQDHDPHEVRNA